MRNTGARPDLPALWLPRYRARGGAERSNLLLRTLRARRWTDRAERSRLSSSAYIEKDPDFFIGKSYLEQSFSSH
jgi:hypothetical protein